MPVTPKEVGTKADYTAAKNAMAKIDAVLLTTVPNNEQTYTFSGDYIDAVPFAQWKWIEDQYKQAGWTLAQFRSEQKDGKWFTLAMKQFSYSYRD